MLRTVTRLGLILVATSCCAAAVSAGTTAERYDPYRFLIGEWNVENPLGEPLGVMRIQWGPKESYIWYSMSILVNGAEDPHFEGILMWNGKRRNFDMLLTLDLHGGRAQEQGTMSVAADGLVLRDITAYYSEGAGPPGAKPAGPEGAERRFQQIFKSRSADCIATTLVVETASGWVPTFPGSDKLSMRRRSSAAGSCS